MLTCTSAARADNYTIAKIKLNEPANSCSNTPKYLITTQANAITLTEKSNNKYTTLSLDCNIELNVVDDSGEFLILADALATVHFIHIPTSSFILSQSLHSPDSDDDSTSGEPKGNTFVHLGMYVHGDSKDLLVVLAQGSTMFRFSNLDLEKLHDAFTSNDGQKLIDTQRAIQVEKVILADMQSVNKVAIGFDKWASTERIFVAGTGAFPLTVWQKNKASLKTGKIDSISSGVLSARDYHTVEVINVDVSTDYLFLLTRCDGLLIFDQQRLIQLYLLPLVNILDFEIDQESKKQVYISSIVQLEKSQKISFMKFNNKGFNIVWEKDDLNNCIIMKKNPIVHQSENTYCTKDDGIISFIDANSASETGMYLHTVSNSLPLLKFEYLIAQKQYDEAINFSKSHNNIFDIQIVYQSKLNHLAKFFDIGDGDLDVVLETLRHVKDIRFISNYCQSLNLPSFQATYQVLKYGLELIGQVEEEGEDESQNDDNPFDSPSACDDPSACIQSLIRKLGTFSLIFSGSDDIWNMWKSYFKDLDMSDGIQNFFKDGDLKNGILIWRRHYLSDNLIENLSSILDFLPVKAPVSSYISWLSKQVLPNIKTLQQSIILTKWIINRTKIIEQELSSPYDALALIEILDCNLQGEFVDLYIPCVYIENFLVYSSKNYDYWSYNDEESKASGPSSEGEDLKVLKAGADKLKKLLQDMVYLKDKHDYETSLVEYSQVSPNAVAFELLDRVAATELLTEAIYQHFKPVTKRNQLIFEDCLVEYCMEIMDGVVLSKGLSEGLEERVLAIIDAVDSEDAKVDIVLELMSRVSIPWSTNVQDVVKKAFTWISERRICELRDSYRVICLRKMLLKYGLSGFSFLDYSLTKSLLRFITNHIDVIDAMDDATLVVSVYANVEKQEPYMMRLRKLCQVGELERAGNLLKLGRERPSINAASNEDKELLGFEKETLLSPNESLSIGQGIITWLVQVMDEAVSSLQSRFDQENLCFKDLVDGNDEDEDIVKYGWALRSACYLSRALIDIRSKISGSDVNQSTADTFSPPAGEINNSGDSPNASSLSSTTGTVLNQSEILLNSATFATAESSEIFSNMLCIFKEYQMVLSWDMYNDSIGFRRRVLREFAKTVFSYSDAESLIKFEDNLALGKKVPKKNHTAVYRLAELLMYQRVSLKGIMAEEAADCGDFKTSLLLCQELFDKFPISETAIFLRNVSHLLIRYIARNSRVYKDLKKSKVHFRLADRILQLSNQILLICPADILCDCLDDFKNFEIQQSIFNHCDAGNYELIMKKKKIAPIPPKLNYSNTGSSSSASHYSSPAVDIGSPSNPAELDNINDKYASGIFEDRYRDTGLVLQTEIAMGLLSTFSMDILNFTSNCNVELGLFSGSPQEESNGVKKCKAKSSSPQDSGRELIEYLLKNSITSLSLRVLHLCMENRWRYSYDKNGELSKNEEDITSHFEIVQKMLNYILSSRSVDQSLSLGCMFSLPINQAFECFKVGMSTTGTDYSRVIKIANVATVVAMVWGQRSFQISCKSFMSNAKWFHQFRLFGIDFDEQAFRQSRNGDYQKSLISELLEKTELDILTVLEFSRCYIIEDDFVLFEYLKKLFLSPSELVDYQTRIVGVIDDIDDKGKLVALLKQIYQEMSPYDYERIQFVLQQILRVVPEDDTTKKHLAALEILWPYTRQNPPDLQELSLAKQANPKLSAVPDDLATLIRLFKRIDRLPLQLISVTYKPFVAELNESSFPQLLPLHRPWNVSSDFFYRTIVSNMLDKMKPEDGTGSGIKSSNKRQLKFNDFKPYLTKFLDTEFAIRITIVVGEAFPCGLDKIHAFKMALMMAERRLQILDTSNDQIEEHENEIEKSEKWANRLKTMVVETETEFQLKTYGLEKFLDLISDPTELVHQLYLGNSEKGLTGDEFPLHDIVNFVAKKHEIDIQKIRLALIDRWLVEELKCSEDDRNLYLPSMRIQINEGNMLLSAEMAIQRRVLYMLRSGMMEKEDQILLLMNFAFKNKKAATLARVRAISVLVQVASPSELADANVDSKMIRNYMQMLLYLADFQELRIIQTLKDFETCDKVALTRSLWVNHNEEPKAVQLICNICLDYGVYDKSLWESALVQLQNFGAFRYLLSILEQITSIPDLSRIRSIPALWNNVLLGSLKYLKNPTKTNVNIYVKIISLIQKCPFLPELETDLFVQYYCKLVSNCSDSTERKRCIYVGLAGLASCPASEFIHVKIEQLLAKLKPDELNMLLDSFLSSNLCDEEISFDACVSKPHIISSLERLVKN